jgi:hypothetical protein
MANEWYIQHGGKEHGPLTSATLKKLAAEGKISPATSIRLGAEGSWVPASRVQGLFSTAQAPAAKPAVPTAKPSAPPARPAAPVAKAAPPSAKPSPAADDFDSLFDAPPPPPQVARPAGRLPVAAAVPLPKAVPVTSGSMPAKILGAIALIVGLVALATCWLPMLDKGPVAWTGIGAGGLGLLLGAGAFVFSAMHKGSSLPLSIAGAGSSAVGLVLTVVLGVMAGMFTSAPPPPVIAARPIVETAKPVLPPPKEPEPPPAPEWFDASQPIQQGDIKAGIASIQIEQVRIEDITNFKRAKPQPMLKIKVVLENTSADKIVEFPGWIGGSDLVGQGLGQLVGGEAGGALAQLAGSGAVLTDNVGNKYKQTPISLVFGGALTVNQSNSIRPGQSMEKELLFDPPLETIEYLRLELPPAGFSGSDSLRFQIPKPMITGLGG